MSFWKVVVTIIIVAAIWAYISDKIEQRRVRKIKLDMEPKLESPLKKHQRYNIFLSHGKMLQNLKFLGVAEAFDHNRPELPHVLCGWLVMEKPDGTKAYIKPESLRYFEDTALEAAELDSIPLRGRLQ